MVDKEVRSSILSPDHLMMEKEVVQTGSSKRSLTNTFALPKSHILTWWVTGSTCRDREGESKKDHSFYSLVNAKIFIPTKTFWGFKSLWQTPATECMYAKPLKICRTYHNCYIKTKCTKLNTEYKVIWSYFTYLISIKFHIYEWHFLVGVTIMLQNTKHAFGNILHN